METVSRLAYPREIGNRLRVMVKKDNVGSYVIGRHQRYHVSEQGGDSAHGPVDDVQNPDRLTFQFVPHKRAPSILSWRA